MTSARANFAAVVAKNIVYVFGGIKGREGSHKPVLADPIVERYDPMGNQWTELIVNNITPLAAFAWTPISEGRIAVLGGSNGGVI